MMQAYGLKTHIWNNNLRCIILLCLFPILLLCLAYALILLWSGFTTNMTASEGLSYALETMPVAAPIALAGAASRTVLYKISGRKARPS